MADRSLIAYDYWKDSSQRFDYFVAGVTGALVAYVAQAYVPQKIGWTPNSLELLSVLILVLSVVAGFRRLQSTITSFQLMSKVLDAGEKLGALTAKVGAGTLLNEETGEILSIDDVEQRRKYYSGVKAKAQVALDQKSDSSLRWYKIRNYLLALGFFALLLSKILRAY